MTTPTPEKEAELRGLLEKATPGPWVECHNMAGAMSVVVQNDIGKSICWLNIHNQEAANAALIVAAINALPDLLSALSTEREGRELAEAEGWRDAVSAVQYMAANWAQDCRTPEDRAALRDAAKSIVDELISASPGDWLGTEWRSAQDWMAQISALQALIAEKDSMLAYWRDGAGIVETCLAVAVEAKPETAVFPLIGREAQLWHQAQAEAYRHALEMMGPPESRANSTEAKTGEPG